MKIIIAGSIEFSDYLFLKEMCLKIIHGEQINRKVQNKYLEFISGTAKGADVLGERFAKAYGFKPKLFPANWTDLTPPVITGVNSRGVYNKLAGHNRNQKMVDYVVENGGGILIAFRINNSAGTTDMIRRAKKANIKVFQVDYDKEKKIKIWDDGL